MESLGLLVGAGFAPAVSPAPVTASVQIILASEGGAKYSSLSQMHGSVCRIGYL